MDHYDEIKDLGAGTWGVVKMAKQKATGRLVAIKKIKSERSEEGINFTAIREIKLLREFKHENIIELVDVFTTPDMAVCLVYEVADTDLEKILKNRAISISLADTKQHLLSLLRAIEACHDRWILHRDLKPDNCLFLKDGTMKLADFGLARMYGTPKTRLSPQAITLAASLPNYCCVDHSYRATKLTSHNLTKYSKCLEHPQNPIGQITTHYHFVHADLNGITVHRYQSMRYFRRRLMIVSVCLDQCLCWILTEGLRLLSA
jgi:serine/threonine protein kinase